MKKSRFREEQMVTILREADQRPVPEVAKQHGVSAQTIYTELSTSRQLEPDLVGVNQVGGVLYSNGDSDTGVLPHVSQMIAICVVQGSAVLEISGDDSCHAEFMWIPPPCCGRNTTGPPLNPSFACVSM